MYTGDIEAKLPSRLIGTLDGCEYPVSCSGLFIHGAYFTEVWMIPRTGLDEVAKRKIPGTGGNWTLALSLVNKVTSFCIGRSWWRTIKTTIISEIFLIRHSCTHFASHLLWNTLLKNLWFLYRSLPAKHTNVTLIVAETLMVMATNPLNGGQQLHRTLICDLLLHMT